MDDLTQSVLTPYEILAVKNPKDRHLLDLSIRMTEKSSAFTLTMSHGDFNFHTATLSELVDAILSYLPYSPSIRDIIQVR